MSPEPNPAHRTPRDLSAANYSEAFENLVEPGSKPLELPDCCQLPPSSNCPMTELLDKLRAEFQIKQNTIIRLKAELQIKQDTIIRLEGQLWEIKGE